MKEQKKTITNEQMLISRYGFDKADYKWIPEGGELLQYIGASVVFVEFIKDASGNWIDKIKEADIIGIGDYDPMTITYNVKYRIKGEDTDSSFREMRIIPEGFSWGSPEETGVMYRFIPYSIHCKLAESEALERRIVDLYNSRPTLPIAALESISASKESGKTLEYACNIQAVIKVEEKIIHFRLSKLSLRHLHKNRYYLTIGDAKDKTYSMEILGDSKVYDFMIGTSKCGELKIIDLQDPKE